MITEINKPVKRKYWFATGIIGGKTMVISGHTDPEQVTTTGLNEIVGFDTLPELEAELTKITDNIDLLPKAGEHLYEGKYYNCNGAIVMANDTCVYDGSNPENNPKFKVV